MRNTQGVKEFLSKWGAQELPSKEMLYDYRPICKNLMYEDEDLVRDTTSLLKRNIEKWARSRCPVYRDRDGMISKSELSSSDIWHVAEVSHESQPMATNGSTTGKPFPYLRWEPFLYFIEAENHYDLIMDEFQVRESPDVMYFFRTTRHDADKVVTVSSESDNFMEHHGLKRRARVHYVNFDRLQNDRQNYMPELVEYLSRNNMDVIFAPGPSINALCYQIKKTYGRPERICGLMSNSNERLLPEDALFLMDGCADEVCDHMRCWDGGGTFFTCKHRNYHLMDNISWCREIDKKFVCTDYFSLASPFVDYWNGDFCRISDTYERCECGRLYRDFEFLENRPFSLKGRSMLEIIETINQLKVKHIKQLRCSAEFIEVVSYSPIQEAHKQILMSKHGFDFRFLVEE